MTNECENEEAKDRAIFSSPHEELSIFIDNDWFVFATLSRDMHGVKHRGRCRGHRVEI